MSTASKAGQNWVEEAAERSTATSKVKAEAGRGGTHIEIKVWSPTEKAEDVVLYRIRRDVKMERLMNMYCDEHSIRSTDVTFMDPVMKRLDRYKTPDEIGLEDGDAIFVMFHERGN